LKHYLFQSSHILAIEYTHPFSEVIGQLPPPKRASPALDRLRVDLVRVKRDAADASIDLWPLRRNANSADFSEFVNGEKSGDLC
jgi:hypothetical protein